MYIESRLLKGPVKMAVVDVLPVEGIDVIVANDVVTCEVKACPVLRCTGKSSELVDESVFEDRAEAPISVITRSKAQASNLEETDLSLDTLDEINESSKGLGPLAAFDASLSHMDREIGWDRESLLNAQKTEFSQEKEEKSNSDLTKPAI